MNGFRRGVIIFVSTGAFSGYVPGIPGTAGSFAGIFFYLLLSRCSVPVYLLLTFLFIIFSIWISDKAEKLFNKKDPAQVVVDEIAGYLVAMIGFYPEWKYIIAGFVLFRIADIIKPYPANRINQNVRGGYGIVLDDVVAGAYANIILQFARILF
jgi:phosphatidylglycerophosphatase A